MRPDIISCNVPLRPANPGSSMVVWKSLGGPVEYMNLWKSADSEPIRFPYTEYGIISKAETQTTTSVDPLAQTRMAPMPSASKVRPITVSQGTSAPAKLPAHLNTPEHQLAQHKGMMWAAHNKINTLSIRGMPGSTSPLTEKESSSLPHLHSIKKQAGKAVELAESQGVKDLPIHHAQLSDHHRSNPDTMHGAAGGTSHISGDSLSSIHQHLHSSAVSSSALQQRPPKSSLSPLPAAGGRGISAKELAPEPTPTSAVSGTSAGVTMAGIPSAKKRTEKSIAKSLSLLDSMLILSKQC